MTRPPKGEGGPAHPAEGFRLAVRMLRTYRAAAWLYHHGPPDCESPLTDSEFDDFERALGLPKQLGHTVQLTDNEQERAVAWARAAASALPRTAPASADYFW